MRRTVVRLGRGVVAAIGVLTLLVGLSGTASAHQMPEIDPGSMVNALLVLSGGLMIIGARRPRK